MVVQHNMTAANANRMLGNIVTQQSKSTEKLSSGYRINRAADDAAGLAISEKMRGQIRGLDKASSNAQDGISLIQTAEGALSETQSILQRMRELSVQSANETNTDQDREELQKEMNQLTSEINRIGNTTEFNTKKLLDGGGTTTTSTVESSKLELPTSLDGGSGTGLATGTVTTFTSQGIDFKTSTDNKNKYDGQKLAFTLGDKTVEFTLNKNVNKADSTSTTIGIKDSDTTSTFEESVRNALSKAIEEDDYLRNNFAVETWDTVKLDTSTGNEGKQIENVDTDDTIFVIRAKQFDAESGNITGYEDGSKTNITVSADSDVNKLFTATEVKGSGDAAIAEVNFTDKKAEDLIGNQLIIDGKNIEFYNSKDGEYTGNANFAVDLKDVSDSKGIAKAVVDELKAAYVGEKKDGLTSSTLGESFLKNVRVYQDADDISKIVIRANQKNGVSNTIANSIEVGYATQNSVAFTSDNEEITGESVQSAFGLKDGQHEISIIAHKANVSNASSTNAFLTGAVSINEKTDLSSGTYKIDATGTGTSAQLKKLESDGTWSDIGDAITIAASTTYDIKGISFTTNTTPADAELTFTVAKQGYTATLKENGDSEAGMALEVESNGTVKLFEKDGKGNATVNVGDLSNLKFGDEAKIYFNTDGGVAKEGASGEISIALQIGANTGQSMNVKISDMRANALNVSGTEAEAEIKSKDGKATASYTAVTNVSDGSSDDNTEYALDISSFDKATAAISIIDDALNSVSSQRSSLGAYQNRLEHTIANLENTAENLQTAESNIRDVDMASEMVSYSKNSILQQAAQSMLAQANQSNQGVLSLLQ